MKFFFVIFIISLSATHLCRGQENQLIVNIDNIKEVKGQVLLGLFNQEEDFLETALINVSVKVTAMDNTKATFSDLPTGYYAISLFHDVNMNNELDKNYMGIPKEGFGFSNNKMGIFGPPSFEDSLVKIEKDTTEITIRLKHF